MAQLSPQKRKKRRVQLREAQRRRRARLKEESKSFLQIILTQETLRALRSYSDSVGKPLHSCAAELIATGLTIRYHPPAAQPAELSSGISHQYPATRPEDDQPPTAVGGQTTPSDTTNAAYSARQMELFRAASAPNATPI